MGGLWMSKLQLRWKIGLRRMGRWSAGAGAVEGYDILNLSSGSKVDARLGTRTAASKLAGELWFWVCISSVNSRAVTDGPSGVSFWLPEAVLLARGSTVGLPAFSRSCPARIEASDCHALRCSRPCIVRFQHASLWIPFRSRLRERSSEVK